jgi:predicted DNA-binding transcriptional regulator AlpA
MLSAKAVAQFLGVSPRMVYSLPIPRYRFGRAVRWAQSDVEAYKASCLSATTPETRGGASNLTVTMKAAGTGLASYFRKAGVEPKLTPTTGKKARDFPLSLVALPERNPS